MGLCGRMGHHGSVCPHGCHLCRLTWAHSFALFHPLAASAGLARLQRTLASPLPPAQLQKEGRKPSSGVGRASAPAVD